MLFTHFGVSGPTILSSSAHLLRYKKCRKPLKRRKNTACNSLKPALQQEKLDNRIQRDFFRRKEQRIQKLFKQFIATKND